LPPVIGLLTAVHYLWHMESDQIIWQQDADLCAENWSAMSDDSRTWVYFANRALSHQEAQGFLEGLEGFLAGWEAHGKRLEASWRLCGNRLLFIAVNESNAPATGCSIDTSVAYLRKCTNGWENPVDWFDRQSNLYKVGEKWCEASNSDFWALRKSHRISDETEVVNVVHQKMESCRRKVVIPFAMSWHAEMW